MVKVLVIIRIFTNLVKIIQASFKALVFLIEKSYLWFHQYILLKLTNTKSFQNPVFFNQFIKN